MTERYEENSKRTRQVEANHVVLAHLMLPKPEPVVLESTDLAQQAFDAVYVPFQTIVEDTQPGFDLDGQWHCVRNSFDDMGMYLDSSLRTEHLDG